MPNKNIQLRLEDLTSKPKAARQNIDKQTYKPNIGRPTTTKLNIHTSRKQQQCLKQNHQAKP